MDLLAVVETTVKIAVPVAGGLGFVWKYAIGPARANAKERRKREAARDERIMTTCDQVEVISKALGPNGGSSLADKVEQTRDLTLIMQAQVTDILDHTNTPLWAADREAHCTRVNRAFEEMFGYPHSELLGSGWLLHVAPSDRDRVTRDWDAAIRERRAFQTKCTYMTAAGLPVSVRISGQPVVDGLAARIIGWRGGVEIEKVPGTGQFAREALT